MKTALVIMAAGLGTRFGGGIKQLEPVGPCGEIIMDYSIHDAVEAGFDKIVFIIRKDIEADFMEVIGDRIGKICAGRGVEVAYAFQSMTEIPAGNAVPEGRTKPWGTGQAVLAAKALVDTPFAVINADDYYGKEAFVKLHEFLCREGESNAYCMAGFILKNTLSDNGGVTRGICQVDEDGFLTDVVETRHIIKTPTGAEADGVTVDPEGFVSMNMWGLRPEFMETLEAGFEAFFRDAVPQDPMKAEYLLPIYIGQLLREGRVSVQVLQTQDKWFGVTYREDKPVVVDSFRKLIADGVYDAPLFG
ncbi:MAG: nucleotidyltransferase [Oscillospiraceae bacterium]|nr:nucleotidyltransferase [Oscillospiraceae bacterium]MBQ5711986.1 nucleotidyltransferase [Oscillospiraceae bacterium]